jgi:hypothetical protein
MQRGGPLSSGASAELPVGPPGSTERRPGAGRTGRRLRARRAQDSDSEPASCHSGVAHHHDATASPGSRSRCPPSPAPGRLDSGSEAGDGGAAGGGGHWQDRDPRIPLPAPGPGGPAATEPAERQWPPHPSRARPAAAASVRLPVSSLRDPPGKQGTLPVPSSQVPP